MRKSEHSRGGEAQFSVSNGRNRAYGRIELHTACVRDQSLLVAGDHFQLRLSVITKERVIAARGRFVPPRRGNRETHRRRRRRRGAFRKISSWQMDP